MSFLEALILGFLQGATEFLPVSSSGHLVMGQALMDIQIPGVAFEVAVHVATLLSVLWVYRKRVSELFLGAIRADKSAWRYLALVVVATIPAAVVGVGAGDVIETLFDSPWVAGAALLVTGTFLWSAKGALKRNPSQPPGWVAAVVIGLAQAVAIIPGISRSGATVVAALWLGIEAEEAAAFSFLMAVPAILGAAVLELPTLSESGMGISGVALTAGGMAAALTGVLAIWTFVALLKKRAFHRFGPYCWGVGVLFLLFLRFGG